MYGNYIDEVLAKNEGVVTSTLRYYAHDHLFSPAALTSLIGTVLERYEYDAYGKVRVMNAYYASYANSLKI